MVMRKVVLFVVTAAKLCVGVSAVEAESLGRPCTSVAQNQWLSIAALQAKVEALGYKVQKAELKNACGELYALDNSGGRVELIVNPASGEILGKAVAEAK
jgi:hypothetical protein